MLNRNPDLSDRIRERIQLSMPMIGSRFGLAGLAQIPIVWLIFPINHPDSDPTPLIGALIMTLQCFMQYGIPQLWRLKMDSRGIRWGFILSQKSLGWEDIDSLQEANGLWGGFVASTTHGKRRILLSLESSELSQVRRQTGSKLRESPRPAALLRWLRISLFTVLILLIAFLRPLTSLITLALVHIAGLSNSAAIGSLYSISPTPEFILLCSIAAAYPHLSSLHIQNHRLFQSPAPWKWWGSKSSIFKNQGIDLTHIESIDCKSSHDSSGSLNVDSIVIHTPLGAATLYSSAVNFPFVLASLLTIVKEKAPETLLRIAHEVNQ